MKIPDRSRVWADPAAMKQQDDSVKAKETEARKPWEDAWKAWKSDENDETSARLLKELNPTIDQALESFARDTKSQVGMQARIMAMKAARSYDPKMGAALPTHVYNNLKGLNRLGGERGNIVRVPEGVLLDRARVARAEANFTSEHNRGPSIEELADVTGLSRKRLASLDTGSKVVSESQALTEKGEHLFGGGRDPHDVWVEYVYQEMDPSDKKIFEWSTGYGGRNKMKKKEMAAQLGISAPAVSSRINRMIARMEEGLQS